MVHFKHIFIYTNFEKLNSLDCECETKIEQNYSHGAVFAIAFLWAKHAGATVLYNQFWTHDSRLKFTSVLGTMTQKKYSSVEIIDSRLNCSDQLY